MRQSGQSQALSTERVKSSIPKVRRRACFVRGWTVSPRVNLTFALLYLLKYSQGGADEGTTWTYPSPQMFYNSLARKNKLGDTAEEEIESVVALHNNMNEKTWGRVTAWEAVIGDGEPPKLLKFMGRPTDLSPKAMLKHYLLGHPLPYDRHDWTILRPDGTLIQI